MVQEAPKGWGKIFYASMLHVSCPTLPSQHKVKQYSAEFLGL